MQAGDRQGWRGVQAGVLAEGGRRAGVSPPPCRTVTTTPPRHCCEVLRLHPSHMRARGKFSHDTLYLRPGFRKQTLG